MGVDMKFALAMQEALLEADVLMEIQEVERVIARTHKICMSRRLESLMDETDLPSTGGLWMTYEHKQNADNYTGPYVVGHQPRIIVEEILTELAKARRKFPTQNVWVTLAALTEEVGELLQGVLQINHEPGKGVTPEKIYAEAVQVSVMAIRVALDCSYYQTP